MPIDPEILMLAAEEVAIMRAGMFRETPLETLERVFLGIAWALRPTHAGMLLPFVGLWIKTFVSHDHRLPAPDRNVQTDGTVGIVNDLSVPTLVKAYSHGLFTSGHFGALSWTSPSERCVLFFKDMHISKHPRRLMRQGRYTVTFDRNFEGVIKACAGRRQGRWHLTWIAPRIMRAYAALFDAGHAHSFEVWNKDGALVGGGYGVSVGRIFFTESQFSLEDHTSKIGFAVLNWHLNQWGYILNDGKNTTPTLVDMGFRAIPRAEFLQHLTTGTPGDGKAGRWQVESDTRQVADSQPQPALAATG